MIEHEQGKIWQTELDAKKYLTQVHMDFKKFLGTDFKLAKFEDKEREFILTILTAGMMVSDLCPHPDIGMELKEMDFAYINTLAVLKFNVDDNMIVDRITGWQKENDGELQEESEYLSRLAKRIKGEVKPRNIEE